MLEFPFSYRLLAIPHKHMIDLTSFFDFNQAIMSRGFSFSQEISRFLQGIRMLRHYMVNENYLTIWSLSFQMLFGICWKIETSDAAPSTLWFLPFQNFAASILLCNFLFKLQKTGIVPLCLLEILIFVNNPEVLSISPYLFAGIVWHLWNSRVISWLCEEFVPKLRCWVLKTGHTQCGRY